MGTGAAGSAKQENTHSCTRTRTHTNARATGRAEDGKKKSLAKKAKREKDISKDGDSPPKLAKCWTW